MSHFKSWFTELFKNLKLVFVRFTLTSFFALALTIIVGVFITYGDDSMSQWLYNLLSTLIWGCSFGIILSFTAQLFNEKHNIQNWTKLISFSIAILLATIYSILFYYVFSSSYNIYFYSYIAMFIVAIILLLAIPFIGQQQPHIVWNYHAKLFYAMVVSFVMSGILALCCDGIIASIDWLFHLNINDIVIIQWILSVCFCFVMPCLLMALVPNQQEDHDTNLAYNKIGTILVRYILFPLICLEGIILYIYGFKILIQWQLPEGGVTYLVFSYAIIGSIIWYLLMPVFLSEEKSWAKYFKRGFFITLIPLLALLFVGLVRRINDYGFTTNRYIVLGLAIWFLFISIIMIFNKKMNIKPALLSLAAVTIIAFIGPWNMFTLPYSLQVKNFEKIAAEYSILKDGKLVAAQKPLNWEQNVKISQAIDFLIHERSPMEEEFCTKYLDISKTTIDSIATKEGEWKLNQLLREKIFSAINGKYIYEGDRDTAKAPEITFYRFNSKYPTNEHVYNISNYDYMLHYENYVDHKEVHTYQFSKITLHIESNYNKNNILIFSCLNQKIQIDLIEQLHLIKRIQNTNTPHHDLDNNVIHFENEKISIQLNIDHINIEKYDDYSYRIEDIDMMVFVKIK